MARRTSIEYFDDLDGSPGAQPYRFGWGDRNYVVDLTDDNAAALVKLMGELTAVARRDNTDAAGAGRSGTSRPTPPGVIKKLRRWWADNEDVVFAETGMRFNNFGRVPNTVYDMYRERAQT